MRSHSIFQEKKLLWSALLPDCESACIEQPTHLSQLYSESSGQGLPGKLALIHTKDVKTNNLEQKKLHITSLSNLSGSDKNTSDIGDPAKIQRNDRMPKGIRSLLPAQPFSSFFSTVSNDFILNRQANKTKLQSIPLPHALLAIPYKVFTLDPNVAKKTIQLPASRPSAQVVLVFSSFEKSDLNKALNLFQSYLTSLTNRLTTIKDFSTNVYKTLPKGKARGPDVLPGTRLQNHQVAAILRAVRDLNQPFQSTSVPLSTKLYTVIRSPHVFKKTREQFAMTKLKRTVKLNFKSKASLSVLVDSLILLKLPAEVKIIIRDYL